MMIRTLIGALAGGAVGYFVLYRLVGCSAGGCAAPMGPYAATGLGAVLGVLAAVALAAPGRAPAPGGSRSAAGYQKMTAEEAKARMDSGDEVIILDVRTPEEYAAGHIPGAILIPNETIADQMPEQLPDPDAEILVYCRSGNRSAQAAAKLAAMGYTNVYDFGGINTWPYDTVK